MFDQVPPQFAYQRHFGYYTQSFRAWQEIQL
jgi:hypothetical protein